MIWKRSTFNFLWGMVVQRIEKWYVLMLFIWQKCCAFIFAKSSLELLTIYFRFTSLLASVVVWYVWRFSFTAVNFLVRSRGAFVRPSFVPLCKDFVKFRNPVEVWSFHWLENWMCLKRAYDLRKKRCHLLSKQLGCSTFAKSRFNVKFILDTVVIANITKTMLLKALSAGTET
jgi:hypothetical protein